ncbi:MAG: selenide, water dikinase SelD [Cyanobacteria bacterium P01_D01_bin.105]
MNTTPSITKDLVLVGGGHSHALVLRKMGMQPWPADVRLTLITNLADTPYSGMLPCHISGLYDFDTAHIDLRPLTRFANCRLMMDEMVGLDAENQKVLCKHHPPIAYDTLSIDVGSTPTKSQVPGAAQYAIPAKPVPNLLRAWKTYLEQLEQSLSQNPNATATISIVGGGVGGVEMAFAMQIRLQDLMRNYKQLPNNKQPPNNKQQIAVHLFQRGPRLAKGRNPWTQRMVETLCREKGIVVHTGERVCEVTKTAVHCESGLAVECDRTFWVTNASAPPWLKTTTLSLTDNGFIAVKDTLQTCSHPNIFAAGDVATMVNHQRPKAGVFAVRQGPPLYENLKRQMLAQPLKAFKPQRRYLNIIDTDTQTSIASWGPFAVHAKWCRAWKDSIDKKFMSLFSDFPKMDEVRKTTETQPKESAPKQTMHCAGCGSKVGANVLHNALWRVRREAAEDDAKNDTDWPYRNNIYAGLDAPDDAAVVQVPAGMLAVHTVDQFTALVDDPFVFGQICVNHCLSDLFAMGATSHNALALATIPYGTRAKQEEILYQLLSGVSKALAASKTFLVGGHTTEGPTLTLGFACNGWIAPERVWRKSGMVPGQSLILTKALGTGTLFAADSQLQAKGRWIEGAIASMVQSNQSAANCLRAHGAAACTDVTGFGLAGHLQEMVNASNVSVRLDLSDLRMLPGAQRTLEQGIFSTLHSRNRENVIDDFVFGRTPQHLPIVQLLFDPQTSGGLLASIPSEQTEACLQQLQRLGYAESRCIGMVAPSENGTKPITIERW